MHKKATVNFAVPSGRIRLVLYDDRVGSKSRNEIQEVLMGEDHYLLVRIPPMIWASFMGLGRRESIVANCSTLVHDPGEALKRDLYSSEIPYDWQARARRRRDCEKVVKKR